MRFYDYSKLQIAFLTCGLDVFCSVFFNTIQTNSYNKLGYVTDDRLQIVSSYYENS